jgi:hypothetical protein
MGFSLFGMVVVSFQAQFSLGVYCWTSSSPDPILVDTLLGSVSASYAFPFAVTVGIDQRNPSDVRSMCSSLGAPVNSWTPVPGVLDIQSIHLGSNQTFNLAGKRHNKYVTNALR